ncbi:unnamed protein product [Alopecurus aequalis]
MRGKAKMLGALLLVLLCLTRHFPGAGGPMDDGRSKKSLRHHERYYDHDHTDSAAAEPRGRGLGWRVSATVAAVALAW